MKSQSIETSIISEFTKTYIKKNFIVLVVSREIRRYKKVLQTLRKLIVGIEEVSFPTWMSYAKFTHSDNCPL